MKRIALLLMLCLPVVLSAQAVYTDHFENGDPIPDYSRVGYHWGDREIPDIPVRVTLKAPKDGSDATALIQAALDKVKTPGAVLLKAGVYNVGGEIVISRSGVVLRGEGEATQILATGTKQRNVVNVGVRTVKPVNDSKGAVAIVEDAPAAQMWLRVKDASDFRPGDRVLVHFDMNDDWIHDLGMDAIPVRSDGSTQQWTKYRLDWERIVVKVEKDTLWFENPLVMAYQKCYARGVVMHTERDRVCECGVEDIYFESEFDPSVKDKKGNCVDEKHANDAVVFVNAEHCWARRVVNRHFIHGCVTLGYGSKNITVKDCVSHEPVSQITGGRRYAFCFADGQLSLYDNCVCDHDRHQFANGARDGGPNVFHNCTGTQAYSDVGPHHRWATGTLYDCVKTDFQINVQDRMNWGSGHGWSGANMIFWNCEAPKISCQSPQVSAKNYAIGVVGEKTPGSRKDNHDRPDGVWEHHGTHVSPLSLYDYQLQRRKAAGIKANPFDK